VQTSALVEYVQNMCQAVRHRWQLMKLCEGKSSGLGETFGTVG
jgi:hypothetical protein